METGSNGSVTHRGNAKGDRSRQEITRIAIDCFAKYGFQGTSVDRIARMAGVTKGAIYYHFRDKEDLLIATVADRISAFETVVQHACEDLAPDRALARIAEINIEQARSNDQARFVITLMVEAIDTNAGVSAQLRDMMRRFRGFIRDMITEGQRLGVFVPEADAQAVASTYTSTILGAQIQFYQDPERFRFDEAITAWLSPLLSSLVVEPPRADASRN